MDGTSGKKKQQPTTVPGPNLSTDGIGIALALLIQGTSLTILCADVQQWEYEEEGYPPVTLGIWDFAGQEVYYTTHQFFLTTRSIYVIVFSISTLYPAVSYTV